MKQQTSFACAIDANCGKCGGAMLNQAYFEDGKWWHSWCAPSTIRKDRLTNARNALIEKVRSLAHPDIAAELSEYDAAKTAIRFDDL